MGLLGDALSFDGKAEMKELFKKLSKSTDGLKIRIIKNVGNSSIILTDRVENLKVFSDKDYWVITFNLSASIFKEMIGNCQEFRNDHLISLIEYYYEDSLIDKQFMFTKDINENTSFSYKFLR